MTATGADMPAAPSRWTAREAEILAATLELLQQNGYERLTVDAVAAATRASKATVYRRWPSKAELVLAAFIEGMRAVATPPDTGSLREDLLALGKVISQQAATHASTIGAVLPEMARNPALSEAMQHEFLDQRKEGMNLILRQAADRGEIDLTRITDELWDVLPGYLVFRNMIPGRPPAEDTLTALVDEVIMPSLTRTTNGH
jgi:AcrR family transcriptional regulator